MEQQPSNISMQKFSAEQLLDAVLAWQKSEQPRDAFIQPLIRLPEEQGFVVRELIQRVTQKLESQPVGATTTEQNPDKPKIDHWREELMACRVKTWSFPNPAGLLVGPTVCILVTGEQGVVLRAQAGRVLPISVCGSLLLLSQTIVMAQNAVNAKELQSLQQQRIESTSTSLSAIQPID